MATETLNGVTKTTLADIDIRSGKVVTDVDTTAKADKSYVDTELSKKATTGALTASEAYLQNLINAKASTSYVDSTVSSAVSGLASKTYVDNQLSSKADKSELTGLATTAYVDNAVANAGGGGDANTDEIKEWVQTCGTNNIRSCGNTLMCVSQNYMSCSSSFSYTYLAGHIPTTDACKAWGFGVCSNINQHTAYAAWYAGDAVASIAATCSEDGCASGFRVSNKYLAGGGSSASVRPGLLEVTDGTNTVTITPTGIQGLPGDSVEVATELSSLQPVVIGNGSTSDSDPSLVVLGTDAYACRGSYTGTCANGVSVGSFAYAYGYAAVAVGGLACACHYSTAVGGSTVACQCSLAAGYCATSSYCSTAIGPYAKAAYAGVAIGYHACATYGIAIGESASVSQCFGIAIGRESSASGCFGVAIGYSADSSCYGVSIGTDASGYDYAVSIGYDPSYAATSSIPAGTAAVRIGYWSSAGDYSVAVGYCAAASAPYSVAIGPYAYNTQPNTALITVGSRSDRLDLFIFDAQSTYASMYTGNTPGMAFVSYCGGSPAAVGVAALSSFLTCSGFSP